MVDRTFFSIWGVKVSTKQEFSDYCAKNGIKQSTVIEFLTEVLIHGENDWPELVHKLRGFMDDVSG